MIAVVVPLALSYAVQSLVGTDAGPVYNNDIHFQPPGYVFAIVWTTLYLLLGLYLNSVLKEQDNTLLTLYIINLAVNLAWMPVVNKYKKLTLGIFMIAAMFCVTMIMSALDPNKYRRAMLAPYLTWLIVAMLLNVELARK